MQIKKAGVVATGALATVAVMGAPAAAAPATHVDATALTKASTLDLARGGGWDAPWGQPQQSAIAVGTGSVGQAGEWQVCGGSAVAGVGGTLDALSPDTVFGKCNNGNIKIDQLARPAVISAISDFVISLATWQNCGGVVGGGVGGTVSLKSPSTVLDGCKNGNVIIVGAPHYEESTTVTAEQVKSAAARVIASKQTSDDARKAWATRSAPKTTAHTAAKPVAKPQHDAKAGAQANVQADTMVNANQGDAMATARHPWTAPWKQHPQSAISVGSNTVLTGATWQSCGGEAVWGVGGVLNASSPATVWGPCDNANVWIDKFIPAAVLSVLDNTRIGVADWQNCGSTVVAGVGGTVALGEPNTVFGDCNNANTVLSGH